MRLAVAAGLGLLLTLGACDGEDPVTSATREIATANHAAAAAARIEAETEARADAEAAAKTCDVEISFGSFGSGVDRALRQQILTLVQADADVVTSDETRWGREGESTLCFRLKTEAAANRLYGAVAAQLPSTSTVAPTTVRHRDGRSRSVAYPTSR